MGSHNEIKRDKRIVLMVTEEERNWIKDIASRTSYKSLSNFCREIIMQVCYNIEDEDMDPERTIIEMEIAN